MNMNLNPQPQLNDEFVTLAEAQSAAQEAELLSQDGFTGDEVTSLLWLRQWYQSGGSDRAEVIRRLEFIRLLVLSGKLEA